jgi:thiosulfate/3-mercaptopyruvate sulfurtransferase
MRSDPLVTQAWLAEHLHDVVVADVRWDAEGGTDAAEAAFHAGHVPGAVFVDADRDLAAPPFQGPGRHPLPSPEAFARTLGWLGIGDEDLVVAYDTTGGTYAARLWWMLDAIAHPVALLDGGLAAWPGQLETGAGARRAELEIAPRPWPRDRIADADAVADAIRSGDAAVIDVRAQQRYRGELEPIDPVAGHIPGAVNVPLAENLDEAGRFRSPEELREWYGGLRGVIAHCGSGLTACQSVLAMRLAGIEHVRLYEGSWSDWIHDPSRPIATGDA